jgi:hypothetical protein
MSNGDELTQLRERLDKLERRCGWLRLERWFWRCSFLLTFTIIGYLIMLESGYRALPTPHAVNCETVNCKYVVTQGVLVNNSDGQKRAVLGTADNGVVSLSLWSPDDKILVAVGTHENGGLAKFLDREGKVNVLTGFYSVGGVPGIHLEDDKGVRRAQLMIYENKSSIILRDDTGKVTFTTP